MRRSVLPSVLVGVLTALGLLMGLVGAGAAQADAPGSISGVVTADGGGPLAGIDVEVYSTAAGNAAAGHFVAAVTSGADGSYTFAGLAPSTVGYTVCFNVVGTPYRPTGSMPDECYDDQVWGGPFPNPFGVTQLPGTQHLVTVADGQAVTGVDAALAVVPPQTAVRLTATDVHVLPSVVAGRLTFRAQVTDAAGGSPVAGVAVTFTAPASVGAPVGCTATSDASGVATCRRSALAALRLRTPGVLQVTSAASPTRLAGSTTAHVSLG